MQVSSNGNSWQKGHHKVLQEAGAMFQTVIRSLREMRCLLQENCVFAIDLADIDGNGL